MKNGEAVVILADAGSDPELVDAGRLAAERVGAQVIVVSTPATSESSTDGLLTNPMVVGAMRAASLVVDLSSSGVGHEQALDELLEGGLRVFSAGQVSRSDLGWFVPHAGLGPRVDAAMGALGSADELVVESHADHQLAVSLSEFRVVGDSAVVDTEGEFAEWPGGTVTMTPGDGTVSGSIAIMPGDINATAGVYVRSPVVLVVESDHVCDILGTGADADLIRAQFESLDNPNAYGMSAIVLGMNRPPRYDVGFDAALLSPSRSLLTGGHITLRFGSNDLAGRSVVGRTEFVLRTATLRAASDVLITNGVLMGSLAPDIYEQAAYS